MTIRRSVRLSGVLSDLLGLRVARFRSTQEGLTGNRPNVPGGSVANCHAPSISDILPGII